MEGKKKGDVGVSRAKGDAKGKNQRMGMKSKRGGGRFIHKTKTASLLKLALSNSFLRKEKKHSFGILFV
jgi:hypothetical protein